MSNEHYYNKDMLDVHFEDIKKSLSGQDSKLEEINQRVKTTNGRVNTLESDRDFTRGALWMLTAFMTVIIIPMLGWALWSLITIDDKIDASVDTSVKDAFKEITTES